MSKRYTDEDIIRESKNVVSMAQLLIKLNLKPSGGNYRGIKLKIQSLGVDTSHWTGQLWSKGTKLKEWSEYKRPKCLKQHLVKLRGNQCETCKLQTWNNKPITLELHHIDGNNKNNEITNLQLLCPNCHSQTDNWRTH